MHHGARDATIGRQRTCKKQRKLFYTWFRNRGRYTQATRIDFYKRTEKIAETIHVRIHFLRGMRSRSRTRRIHTHPME